MVHLVLVSHFHLDHCAALPLLTERYHYKGPIYASDPTKAILPYMLKDFIGVSKECSISLTQMECDSACNKVKPVFLKETLEFDGVKLTPFYAGHVLGAVMFLIEKDGLKVLYTGDYNTSPDRHLRACEVDRVQPDLVISESTYGTVNREWRKERELKFVQEIKETFDKGGKVLIPVFALGRAQEFFVLIENIWKQKNWTYPVFFSSSLSSKVHFFY